MADNGAPQKPLLNLQTGATVLTAVFAVYVFFEKERPLLEERAGGQAKLTWVEFQSTGVCRASLDVMLKNDGVKEFEVEKVQVRAWLLDEQKGPVQSAIFIDTDAILRSKQPIYNKIYDIEANKPPSSLAAPMVAKYFAGMSYESTFEWLVPHDPNKRFMARVDLYRKKGDSVAGWYFNRWSTVCQNPPVMNEPPK